MAVVTSSSSVTGRAGTAALSSSAPVGATVIIVPVLAMEECLPVRAVVQRVSAASVTVAGQVVAELAAPGLLVLVGVTHDDTAAAKMGRGRAEGDGRAPSHGLRRRPQSAGGPGRNWRLRRGHGRRPRQRRP